MGLDTSGTVRRPGFARPLSWSDLSPFEQGYVEALLTDVLAPMKPAGHKLPFRRLAPETLALILRDCEARPPGVSPGLAQTREAGGYFWQLRNTPPGLRAFPPLTPYLGDDGKIRFRSPPGAMCSTQNGQAREENPSQSTTQSQGEGS